jgi:hypothetical protein
MLRDARGSVQVVHEAHHLGLFPRETWRRLLAERGFDAQVMTEVIPGEQMPRVLFVGRRPAG